LNIGRGAVLDLNFKGEMKVRRFTLDNKPQAPGTYRATSTPGNIKGTGVLSVQH